MAYYILKSYKLKGLQPLDIFHIFNKQKNCFFLDSSLKPHYSLGRFSFLGCNPFFISKTNNTDPFPTLKKLFGQYSLSIPNNKFPFLGGAVGYLTYDLGLTLEKKIIPRKKKRLGIPDCLFAFYNTIIIIDHFKQLLYICAVGFPEKNGRLGKLLAEFNLKKTRKLLYALNADARKSNVDLGGRFNPQPLKSNFSREGYCRAIKKAKEYIRRGDIYQVNLSQQFQAKTNLPALEIYQRLRRISPSYFGAYFDAGGFQILSSSPERFLSLEGNLVTTRPMKGTRPRSQNILKDKRFQEGLLKSTKDKAELIMIVDLERNDLGRVCSYNSVKVAALRQLEKYSTVFQTTANIRGRLHQNKDRFDLLRACFPGGSITGCPKIRAMEIIEELEPDRRSIYTGCLGYLSFSGDMDFNILIRTLLKKERNLYFGVGGGIVADSNPEDEYRETLVKARGMIAAINTEGGERWKR